MKITAVVAFVLALSATSAMAEGDCAAKYTAALAVDRPETTASVEPAEPRTDPLVVVAQGNMQIPAPATVNE